MTISPGETVGPYRVIEQLGSGGMATVFKAYHAALDRYVAIKILHPAFKADPQFFQRFEREARIVANLEHPNIIPVYDFNEHNGEPYLVMRYVEGDTLKPLMEGNSMPADQVLRLMRPICQALGYAHRQGVLHRDIKPSNIMITHDGSVFLSDFGLARMVQAGESTLSQDMMVGTPQYISPEQAQGVSELDGRTDIYSLGVVLFEKLTGQVPFNADTPFATVHDHIYTPLPVPSTINPDIDPAAERLLLKALSKEPDDRFDSAETLLDALEKTLTPQMAATPTAAAASVPKKTRGVPWWVWAGSATFVICVVGLLLAGLLIARNRNLQQPDRNQPVSSPVVDSNQPIDSDEANDSAPTDGEIDQPVEEFIDEEDEEPEEEFDEEADEISPEDRAEAVELTNQGRQAMRQQNYEEAADLFGQAIEINPEHLPAYFGLSEALNNAGLPEESFGALEEAVANNPDKALAWAKLGESLLFTNEEPEAALEAFAEASALEPEAPEPIAAQGLALLFLDEDDAAKEMIDEALAMDSDNYTARLASTAYLVKQGQRIPARREIQQLLSDSETPPLIKERARQLLEMLQR